MITPNLGHDRRIRGCYVYRHCWQTDLHRIQGCDVHRRRIPNPRDPGGRNRLRPKTTRRKQFEKRSLRSDNRTSDHHGPISSVPPASERRVDAACAWLMGQRLHGPDAERPGDRPSKSSTGHLAIKRGKLGRSWRQCALRWKTALGIVMVGSKRN